MSLAEIWLSERERRRARHEEETIVFDSSGRALQDVAAAVAVYRRAIRDSGSPRFSFNA
jgi:ornithine cyclodeaminase/alanine dehydrogenase-like protein (mu-crystallin family)